MLQESTGHRYQPASSQTTLILASGSPRRKELLASLGLQFQVILPEVDEKSFDVSGLTPREQALALARFKGESVATKYPETLVVSADTLVVIDNEVLGKPEDRDDAFQMLSKLQGREHVVISATAVFQHGTTRIDALETMVKMRSLSSEQIWQYIDTGEPMDKAGSYAIQGYGSVLIERIDGCYFNVVGLSLVLLDKLCQELGKPLVF
jgi:septum formation protein